MDKTKFASFEAMAENFSAHTRAELIDAYDELYAIINAERTECADMIRRIIVPYTEDNKKIHINVGLIEITVQYGNSDCITIRVDVNERSVILFPPTVITIETGEIPCTRPPFATMLRTYTAMACNPQVGTDIRNTALDYYENINNINKLSRKYKRYLSETR